ncbi:MAG: hypothetical protein N3D84_02600, partial [Candidatus Woesearchaeota archaeon]|nr:hypothetical protein [Candidatus Woesearchaeota archaeon]
MSADDMGQKIKQDVKELVENARWGLKDFVEGLKDAYYGISKMQAKRIADLVFFGAAVPAIVMQYGCGGGGGGDEEEPDNPHPNPTPDEKYTFDFDKEKNLKPFYT